MNAKYVKILLMSFLLLLQMVLGPSAAAFAASLEGVDAVDISAAVDKSELTGPGNIQVTVTVVNGNDSDITDVAVTKDGAVIKSIGTIKSGNSGSTRFAYGVKEEELGKAISFLIKWNQDGNPGEKIVATPVIKQKVITPKLSFNRTVDKTAATQNQEVTLTYTLENTGNVALSNVAVSDGDFGIVGRVASLGTDSGSKKAVFKKTVKVTEDFTSEPAVSYNVGDKAYNTALDPLTIKLANAAMVVELKADKKTVTSGSMVTLTCTLKNTGNMDFSGVQVQDDTLGKVLDNKVLLVGKTIVFTKKVAVDEEQSFVYHVSAKDSAGRPFSVDSDKVTVATSPSASQIQLEVQASADVTELDSPGKVDIEVTVSNKSPGAVKNVVVSEDTLGEIGKMDTMEPGDKLFKKTIDIAESTTYIFKVSTTDSNGNVIEESSEPLEVKVGESTAADETETVTPDEQKGDQEQTDTVPKASNANGQQDKISSLFTILGIILFLIIAAVVTVVILILQERRSKAAKHRRRM